MATFGDLVLRGGPGSGPHPGEGHTLHPITLPTGDAKAIVVGGRPLGYAQPNTTGGGFLAHHFGTGGMSGHPTEGEAVKGVLAMEKNHLASGVAPRFQPPAGIMNSHKEL